MFAFIGFIIKLAILFLGILFIVAGVNKWRWFSKLVFGKKNRDSMGESMANYFLIGIGGAACLLALVWIF